MKNILFITYDFPYPTNTGGKNRAYHMLKYSKGDFKKYLFSFVRPDFDTDNIYDIEKIGVEVVGTKVRRKSTDLKNILGLSQGKSIFKSLYFSKKILVDLLQICADKNIDIIHFESFYTAFYLSDTFKALGAKQIYGSENIEYRLYEEFAKGKGILKPILDMQVKVIKKEEFNMYKNADACLAVTDSELDLIKKSNNNCYKIENGIDVVDIKFKKPESKSAKNLLFVGNFSYFPNVSAIEQFYKNIFKDLENVHLTIVGKKSGTLSFIGDSNVEAIEFIEDIKDAYYGADILVSPIKIGGGTNFKVLEAMAAGVPVIAYEDRSAAIGGTDNKHMIVAVDDNDFSKKITELLADLPRRQKIAEAARKFVEEKYSWENIGKKLAKVWETV